MASTKIKDLAVKTGEYTDGQGQTKGRYENIGSLMQGDDGGMFLIMKRTFNPAGVINPDNRDSVMVGCFDPKEHQQGGGYQQPQQQQQQQHAAQAQPHQQYQQPQYAAKQYQQQPMQQPQQPPAQGFDNFDENIPF